MTSNLVEGQQCDQRAPALGEIKQLCPLVEKRAFNLVQSSLVLLVHRFGLDSHCGEYSVDIRGLRSLLFNVPGNKKRFKTQPVGDVREDRESFTRPWQS